MAKFLRPLPVLVVDDEKVIADTLVGILRFHNYDAAAFYNAAEALDWCRDRSPFAVITDVILGSVSGVQLARHLVTKFPQCKVLIISGHAEMCARLLDSKVFNDRFTLFAKPVDPQKILDFLAKP